MDTANAPETPAPPKPGRPKKHPPTSARRKQRRQSLAADLLRTGDGVGLFEMLPGRMQIAINRMDEKYLNWSEGRLEKHIDETERPIEDCDNIIRLQFWAEYYRTMDSWDRKRQKKPNLNMHNILNRVSNTQYFYAAFLDPGLDMRLAWLLTPPPELGAQQHETLQVTMKAMRRLVCRDDFYDVKETIKYDQETGKEISRVISRTFNARAAELVLKVAETLTERVQGSVVQKHAIVATQLNSDQGIAPATAPQLPRPEDLEGRLKEINARLGDAEGTIEAEYEG